MSVETHPTAVPKARGKDRDPKATESEMLDLLERSLAKHGNGGSGEYAFMRQVRNAAGFDAKRTFDGVAVGLWPSRGHDIHIYEVKVSRSDWLRELAKPEKAEDAAKVGDRFSIVAPRDCVDLAEVPATWGLIHAIGGVEITEDAEPSLTGALPRMVTRVEGRKLRTVRAAPLLHPADRCGGPIARSFLVPLLRAAGGVPDTEPASERQIRAAVHEATVKLNAYHREEIERYRDRDAKQAALTDRFMRATGLWVNDKNAEEVGAAVKLAMAGNDGVRFAKRHLERALVEIERSCAAARDQLARIDEGLPE